MAGEKDAVITISASPHTSETSSLERSPEMTGARPTFRNQFHNLALKVSFWVHDWTPFMLVVTYFIVSVCIYMFLPQNVFSVFWFFYLLTNFYIAGSTVVEAVMSIGPCRDARKAVTALEKNNFVFPSGDDKLPILDIIIVAYLPNEKDIVVDRVIYALTKIVYPREKLRINLVYNTPIAMEPLENELFDLAAKYENFRVIKVLGSKSKADNLNFFLTLDTGSDVIAIFDCDHYPHPMGPRWAMERFVQDPEVDIVQGRCIIFNSHDSFLAAMVAVEFDKIYAVSHPGRAAMWGFGLFCGSNGYWRASLLRELKMDGEMLTEDIDSALRAFSGGAKTVHELNATSYELSPTQFSGFWKQRLRWAQGWCQASYKHIVLAWGKSPEGRNRSWTMRFGVLSLLLIRELSYYLVTQYTCFVISIIITAFPKNGSSFSHLIFFQYPLSEWLFIISAICLIGTLWITNLARSEFVSTKMIIAFSLTYPIQLIFAAMMGLYGHARQAVRYSNWNPTSRT